MSGSLYGQDSRPAAGRVAKTGKDIDQASVLCAALAQPHPGAIEDAVSAFPRKMVNHFRKALPAAKKRLETMARGHGLNLVVTSQAT